MPSKNIILLQLIFPILTEHSLVFAAGLIQTHTGFKENWKQDQKMEN